MSRQSSRYVVTADHAPAGKRLRKRLQDAYRKAADNACQHLSHILDGSDKRGEEARLIKYIMYEYMYEIQGNRYSTQKLKLSSVRSAMMEEGYSNPLEAKRMLARHMRGIKALRGAIDAKEPLPATAFSSIVEQTKGLIFRRWRLCSLYRPLYMYSKVKGD